MSNLDEYKFTEFSTHKPTQEKFLESVESGMSLKAIPLIPGTSTTFPVEFPEEAQLSPGFYAGDDTVDAHKSKHPQYHDIIFPMMESIANGISLPPGPLVTPFQDPTVPLQKLIAKLSFDVEITPEILSYIISKASDFIEALDEFPEKIDNLQDLILGFPPGNLFDEDELEKELKDLQDTISFSFEPPAFPPALPIPEPPFIDIPPGSVPLLSMPNVGIVDFILQLINSAITAVFELITAAKDAILEFFNKVMEGIASLVEWLFGLIYNILSPIILAFKELLASLGWVSTIGTILKYTIGMIIVTVIAFILGPGLIAAGVAKHLGLN